MNKSSQLYETDFNYKVFERQKKIMKLTNEITGEKTVIAVKLERKSDGLYIIDPLVTSFLKDEFWISNASLNTQKKYARVICSFLNYCRTMVQQNHPEFEDLKQGVFSLKTHHACLYLIEQVDRCKRKEIRSSTVLEMEYPLLRFYQYLLETKVITEEVSNIFKFNTETRKLEVAYNPFRQLGTYRVPFPKKEYHYQSVRDFSNDSFEKRIECINLMIDLARIHYPNIALPLCFMFYGGLRLGEVVNLTRKNLERPKFYDDEDCGEESFVLLIEDNPQLFEGFKTKANNQVKRKTKYVALEPLGLGHVSEVYREHKAYLKELQRLGKLKNNVALFYSSYTGNPLTYHTAYNQFKNLVAKFIDELVERGDKKTLENLTDSETGEFKVTPHLCRAVFTNLGIDLGYTKEQMRIRRGDLTDEAQQVYWDQRMVKERRKETIEAMQRKTMQSYDSNKE